MAFRTLGKTMIRAITFLFLFTASVSFFGAAGDVQAQEVSVKNAGSACHCLPGETRDRLLACLRELKKTEAVLSEGAKAQLVRLSKQGRLMVIGGRLPLSLDFVRVGDTYGLTDLLLSDNEERLAQSLRGEGVRGLLVHRRLSQTLDRDRQVISRLARHDFLEWFQLVRVTEDYFIYAIRPSPARISLASGEMLLAGLRARLGGGDPPRQRWQPKKVEMIASLRLQGQTLARRYVRGHDLERALDAMATKLTRRWEHRVQIMGLGRLGGRLKEIRLEIHLLTERAHIESRSRSALFDLYEMGVDGVIFRNRPGLKNQRFVAVPGSELITHSFKSADIFLKWAVQEGGWSEVRPWLNRERPLEIIRDQHFMEKCPGGGEAVRMFRGRPEVSQEDLSNEAQVQMLVDAGEWWLRNMRPDGSFNYKYWPAQNRISSDYNEVRHILAARDLSDLWRYRRDPRYIAGARRAMDWLLKYQVRWDDPLDPSLPNPPPGTILFRYPFQEGEVPGKTPNQKLGTVAVALLGWIAWAKATDSHDEDERIRQMARFVASRLEDNGRFDPYYVPASHPYYGQKNDIVPGQAALALGEVAAYFNEPGWLEFFPGFLDYYQPWFRSRAEKKKPCGRWPETTYDHQTRLDLVQFAPWAVMACKQYYLMTKDARAAEFGLEIGDWIIENYQWTRAKAPFPDYVGGYYKRPDELPAMQSLCYAEGTAAAYHIAVLYKPQVKEKYDEATKASLFFAKILQYDEVDSYFAAENKLIHGGVRYALNQNKIRIDYVGHAMSALSQYLDARQADQKTGQ